MMPFRSYWKEECFFTKCYCFVLFQVCHCYHHTIFIISINMFENNNKIFLERRVDKKKKEEELGESRPTRKGVLEER